METLRTSLAGKMTKENGFSYIIVLASIIIVSISVQVATELNSRITRSEKETQLLFRGAAYLQAIASYHNAVPERPAYPQQLSDLEKDPRFLLKRHIRQLYPEPFAGEWRLLRDKGGGIIGVASPSHEAPLKVSNFAGKFVEFSNAKSYSDWEFIHIPVKNDNVLR